MNNLPPQFKKNQNKPTKQTPKNPLCESIVQWLHTSEVKEKNYDKAR